jgi:hypothetical protein
MLCALLSLVACGDLTAALGRARLRAFDACDNESFQSRGTEECFDSGSLSCRASCFVDGWDCSVECDGPAGASLHATCSAGMEICVISATVMTLPWTECTVACRLSDAAITIIIVGVLLVVGLVVGIIACCCCCACMAFCCQKPPAQPSVIVAPLAYEPEQGYPPQYGAPPSQVPV